MQVTMAHFLCFYGLSTEYTFCVLMDFLHSVLYSNATNALWNNQFDKNIYGLRLPIE